MATLNYIIKSERKTTFATLWIRLRSGREYDIFVQSGYSIPPELWNNKTQKIKPKFTDIDDFTENSARELTNSLNTLRAIVLNALNDSVGQSINKLWLEKIVHTYHNPAIAIEKSKMSLEKFIDKYLDEIESGTRLTVDKKHFSHGTVKAFKGFKERYEEFCKFKRKKFDFNDVNLEMYDEFVAYFTKKNYSINTIGRHIKELKILMRVSRDEGYHNNGEVEKRKFKVVTAKVDNIYLTEKELASMYALDLTGKPHLDVARDVFLIGCYTAQRYSDYSIIGEQNIRKLNDGEVVIDFKQLKTGNRVVIPARMEVLEILAKYENKLPKTYEQKVNRYIKEVAQMAEITEPIEVEQMENGRLVKNIVPKNELVKTHTARRSGATNMYLAGIPAISIMKITGHKTEKEFMKYIKATEEETAIELMSHPYFSRSKR
jgi:integrase